MFLRRRAKQAEYFDTEDRPPLEVAADYQELARVNRLFVFSHPFEWLLPRWLGEPRCQRLCLLDLGAGDGSLGQRLAFWARGRGWHWRVTDVDKNPVALALSDHVNKVGASALSLPFQDGSFDIVIASQMTHHFCDAEVVQHWREAWRVAREAMLISDLHRNVGLYGMVWLATRLLRLSPRLRADGLLSVARGFRVSEWQALAGQAGIEQPQVMLYFGSRILLRARKQQGAG